MRKRYLVIADLSAYGAPPMPVALLPFCWQAVAFAWLTTWVTHLPCEVDECS